MRAFGIIIALTIATVCGAADLELKFAWKEVDYVWNTPADRVNALKEERFIPAHNLPVGLARWKNKLFVTVPRWNTGVVSSLNYVDIDGPQDQPLKPYPSFEDNYVSDTAKGIPSNSSIVSVFRVFVDACDRLWVIDTGLADRRGSHHQVAEPAIVIFDLNTDKLLHRYLLKPADVKYNSFFANIMVDVDKDTCDDAYAYIADIISNAVVVYSLKQEDSWRVTHIYFHFEPLAGAYNMSGFEFTWTDGVFGLALSEPRENGFRTLYFHSLSSTKEFYVSTEILRNYPHLNTSTAFHGFKYLGDRGENTQASASYYEEKSNVLFYTQVSRDGVGCWNTKKPFTHENNPLIISDPVQLEFPIDMKLDNEDNLWVLSDKLPRYFYSSMDPSIINYRILSIKTSDAIAGTTCE